MRIFDPVCIVASPRGHIENKKFSSTKIGAINVSYGRNIKSLMKMDPGTFLGHAFAWAVVHLANIK